MKIICFTDNSPGGRYTANQLHARHGLDLAVVENAKRNLFMADMKRFGARETLHRVGLVMRRLIPNREYSHILDRNLGDGWREFNRTIDTLNTTDVNSREVQENIQRVKPGVIICHGTMLVRAATIKDVRYPLNIHHGLSPLYRGSRCVEWAIAVGDTLNIGVTVHRLTPTIDGGAIFGQARVQIAPDDSVASISSKIVHLGVEIASDAISRLKSGVALSFVEQANGQGAMFWRRQYSRFITMHVEELLGRGELARMIKNPSFAERPLVAPWPSGTDTRDNNELS